ncbi:Metallophosphoesterase domain-containing protein 1 [Tolypocladium ophioglossoides CBS 100239]|uniref:Metallophosphoesterase domain-containing protein 1 n=1 Tax=Tolypocladium ophioglossoides (strain CBS 100239) TaxID=1163406 RepID=A0A0L0N269_TOLOC|nr:Metallophosphoesterase domain-containing protein 1 [Tolypocladium ophioglossoides CBS 100239]
MGIKTRLLIISDTHGQRFTAMAFPAQKVDVAIHCGDLTQHSTLAEVRRAIAQLKRIDAELKLVIAGDRDFSLDILAFLNRLSAAARPGGELLDSSVVQHQFGDYGEARRLLKSADKHGIKFLDEGMHRFYLANGTRLKVYASPYTPASPAGGYGAFQYRDAHEFAIEPRTNVVITHGPPRGIMDLTGPPDRQRVGCPHLFAAVARAQPRVHCFGHVSSGWGARVARWRPQTSSDDEEEEEEEEEEEAPPCAFSHIDWRHSEVVESVVTMKPACDRNVVRSEAAQRARAARQRRYEEDGCCTTSHCKDDEWPVGRGRTLFVNASLQTREGKLGQLPWVVDLELPPSTNTVRAAAARARKTAST